MAKRMLIDAAHEEEMRVAVIDGNRLEDFDFESKVRKQLKGNIYLAKVTRVEPSLQACFVEYGGNRQGFLAFSEIHPDYYRIPVEDRIALLEEERRIAELEEQEAAIEDDRAMRSMEFAKDTDAHDFANESGLPYADDAGHVSNVEHHEDAVSDDDNEKKNTPPENDIMLAENETQDDKISGPELPENDGEPVAEEKNAAEPEVEIVVKKSRGRGARKSAEQDAQADVASEISEQAVSDIDTEENADISSGNNDESGSDESDAGHDNERHNRRHGEGHSDRRRVSSLRKRYKIQEVITRRQIMLVQVTKEERGNKGAALTSYISLPGRYCVLMPNSPRGGGISRKISNPKDRRHMREIIRDMNVPEGMSVILRTAGLQRNRNEIKRDLDYLLRLWDSIRQLTLESIAPSLIYEEGDLAKRAIRDLYGNDVDEVLVNEDEAYKSVKDFMKMLMPSHSKKVRLYKGEALPLFHRYQVESQIDEIYKPEVRLKSGGYIVINPTEALVSIDVNSGKSTRERNIDETALKTNLEAADEVARQLRLRDLGGLVVVDFIDMESSRHNMKVERRMREAMAGDRARVEVGRMSQFGLLELSRQRLRPSFAETHFEKCEHCAGIGLVRTVESAAVVVLREIEEEGLRNRAESISVSVPSNVALYLLNQKRPMLTDIEKRYNIHIFVRAEDKLSRNDFRVEPLKARDKSADKDINHALSPDNPEFSEHNDVASESGAFREDDRCADSDEQENGTENNNENTERSENTEREGRFRRGRGNRNRFRSGFRHNRRDGESGEEKPGVSDNTEETNDNREVDETGRSFGENGGHDGNRRNGNRRFDRNRRRFDRNRRFDNNQEDSVPAERYEHVSDAPQEKREQHEPKPEMQQKPQIETGRPQQPKVEKTLVVGSDAGVETVNLKPENPKRGWWKKLVE